MRSATQSLIQAARTLVPARPSRALGAAAMVAVAVLAAIPQTALAVPMAIHEWTFDDGTARDVIGTLNGTLHGDATISNGKLVLDGSHANGNAYMSTATDSVSLTTMTLVSWVSLGNLSQGGGSALSIVDPSQAFNAIDYGERTSRQWMAGSDGFHRSLVNDGGALVTDLNEHMLAITYDASGHIQLYLDGVSYADGGTFAPFTFTNQDYLIGLRHPAVANGNGLLTGSIDLASVYSTALSASDITTLYGQGPVLTAVPEPGTVALLAAGFGLLLAVRRQRV